MLMIRRSVFGILVSSVLAQAPALTGQTIDRSAVVSAIDSIVTAPIEAGQIAGASVAVVWSSDTIVLRSYGFADLEYHVPTPERAIYEIGSVTKQFTAAAVLQLVAQGAMDLDEVFTTYLPAYPGEAHGITVRRLMDHTSGIKGYTEMPEFGSIATRSLPRDSLVAMFAAVPLDFPPGEALIYNNSAYFLLGLIIEAVSGRSYEDYVAEHLFGPAQMPDSRYCSHNEIIERRAHGYDAGAEGLVRKSFIDHTWPFSAGSLCSTAWDLVAWNEALHGDGEGGHLLSQEQYEELVSPGTLVDGTPVRYAKGLAVYETGGRRVISHGGGIPGFLSQVSYYPEDDLSVIVLINTAGPPGAAAIADSIVELLLGEADDLPARSYSGDLEDLRGTYSGPGRGGNYVVTIETGSTGITATVGEGEPRALRFIDGTTFGIGNSRYTFVTESGVVQRLLVDQISGVYRLSRQAPQSGGR